MRSRSRMRSTNGTEAWLKCRWLRLSMNLILTGKLKKWPLATCCLSMIRLRNCLKSQTCWSQALRLPNSTRQTSWSWSSRGITRHSESIILTQPTKEMSSKRLRASLEQIGQTRVEQLLSLQLKMNLAKMTRKVMGTRSSLTKFTATIAVT